MFQTVSRGMILAFALVFFASLAQAQQYAALVMDARTGKVLHAVERRHPRASGVADQDDDALHRLRRDPPRPPVARPEGDGLASTPPPSRRRGSG